MEVETIKILIYPCLLSHSTIIEQKLVASINYPTRPRTKITINCEQAIYKVEIYDSECWRTILIRIKTEKNEFPKINKYNGVARG